MRSACLKRAEFGSAAEVASSNHTDADFGARSLIQIKLALSGTALFGSSESGISNRLR